MHAHSCRLYRLRGYCVLNYPCHWLQPVRDRGHGARDMKREMRFEDELSKALSSFGIWKFGTNLQVSPLYPNLPICRHQYASHLPTSRFADKFGSMMAGCFWLVVTAEFIGSENEGGEKFMRLFWLGFAVGVLSAFAFAWGYQRFKYGRELSLRVTCSSNL